MSNDISGLILAIFVCWFITLMIFDMILENDIWDSPFTINLISVIWLIIGSIAIVIDLKFIKMNKEG